MPRISVEIPLMVLFVVFAICWAYKPLTWKKPLGFLGLLFGVIVVEEGRLWPHIQEQMAALDKFSAASGTPAENIRGDACHVYRIQHPSDLELQLFCDESDLIWTRVSSDLKFFWRALNPDNPWVTIRSYVFDIGLFFIGPLLAGLGCLYFFFTSEKQDRKIERERSRIPA